MTLILNKKAAVLLFLACSSAVLAQTGTLQGTVTDAESGLPIPNARVILSPTKRGVAANASGEFRIERVPQGFYSVAISSIGFHSHQERVMIADNET